MEFQFFATVWATGLHPTMPISSHYLLPASSWSKHNFRKPKLPKNQRGKIAVDSGAYTATLNGTYGYSFEDYTSWIESFDIKPEFAACFDHIITENIAKDKKAVRERQEQSTKNAFEAWNRYRDTTVWIPTIQGYDIEDYIIHSEALLPLIGEMKSYYPPEKFRVGIGSLCQRDNETIGQVIQAVNQVLEPANVFTHLWGVKLRTISQIPLEKVKSVDSSVWNIFGMKKSGLRAKAERLALGITKAEYAYKVMLPRYERKIQKAYEKPKQKRLF